MNTEVEKYAYLLGRISMRTEEISRYLEILRLLTEPYMYKDRCKEMCNDIKSTIDMLEIQTNALLEINVTALNELVNSKGDI